MSSTTNDRDDKDAPGNERLRAKNPMEFFAQVRQEGRRVTWATRQEVQVATIMVLIMVVAAMIFLGLVDAAIGWVVRTFIVPQ